MKDELGNEELLSPRTHPRSSSHRKARWTWALFRLETLYLASRPSALLRADYANRLTV